MQRNHEVEKLYMEQLRNIETAVYVIGNERENLVSGKNRLKIPTRVPSLQFVEPYKPELSLSSLFVLAIVAIVFLVVVFKVFGTVGDWLCSDHIGKTCPVIVSLAVIAGYIAVFCMTIKDWKEYDKQKKKYENEVKKHENEITRIKDFDRERLKDTSKYDRAIDKADAELKKALNIRNRLYSINWIPIQYRNIRVVYYIYDMVSTSDISIDEALKYYLLQETNNKLDVVIKKLDNIIENQNEIIANQAVAIAQNQRIINKNKAMLEKMQSIENNTHLAADYAALSARYSEANAYFSMATYFKR